MIFEPAKTRKGFEAFLLKSVLGTVYDGRRPMGNVAQSMLGDVVKAWLVGLHAEIAPVVPRLLDWLERAIDEDEDFGTSRNFHRLTLHRAKALGLWMSDSSNAAAVWSKARQFDATALEQDQNVWPKNLVGKDRLDDFIAFCYQAGEYEAGITEFEKYHAPKSLSLKRTLPPRELGYALCLHEARRQFESAELFEAGRKMLQSKLEDDWLGRGQAIRAATWLKIVIWHHDQTLSPLQVVLSAYDNMPNVQRPEFA